MTKLPKFANEQEEAEFWETHDLTDYLDNTLPVRVTFVDAREPKKQISLRLDNDTIEMAERRWGVTKKVSATRH